MRMENEVSGTSAGNKASTSAKTWESVTTRRGGRARAASRSGSPSTPVAQGKAPASSASRMTCCWGRMMRPLGAAESSGMTSTTTSPGVSRSPTSRRSPAAPAARVARARFRSLQPLPCPRRHAHAGGPVRERLPEPPDPQPPLSLTGASAKRQGGVAVALSAFLDPRGGSAPPDEAQRHPLDPGAAVGQQYLSRLKQGRLIRGTQRALPPQASRPCSRR